MSWEIYEREKFLDYLGSSYNLKLLMDLRNDTISEFIAKAHTPEGAKAKLVKATIAELSKDSQWDWLVDILKKAKPPVLIADGTEGWLKARFPNEEWLEPE